MGFDLNGAAKAVLEDSKLNSGNYFSKKDNYIDALEEAIAAIDFVKWYNLSKIIAPRLMGGSVKWC